MSKGTKVTEVVSDGFGGYMCAKGHCAIYVDKIESGPRIGTRITWRHVERHPMCEHYDLRGAMR